MKISIITPSYNQGRFIKKTIQSVIQQKYSNIEYIVIDGGSTDGTIKILHDAKCQMLNAKLKNKTITFQWISKKDKGQADAINKGLRLATGDIIGIINSDDYYEKNALEKVANFFSGHKNAMWVTGDCRIVNENNREIYPFIRWYKRILRLLPLSYILPIANPIAQPSTFFRRKVIKKAGYFDGNLRYAFDYDYWFQILRLYPIHVLSHILSSFRIHKESKGWNDYRLQLEEEGKVQKKHITNTMLRVIHTLHTHLILIVYNTLRS